MSADLQDTLKELEELLEDQRSTIIERMRHMISRAKIDDRLAQSEARGGEAPVDVFFVELKRQYGG